MRPDFAVTESVWGGGGDPQDLYQVLSSPFSVLHSRFLNFVHCSHFLDDH